MRNEGDLVFTAMGKENLPPGDPFGRVLSTVNHLNMRDYADCSGDWLRHESTPTPVMNRGRQLREVRMLGHTPPPTSAQMSASAPRELPWPKFVCNAVPPSEQPARPSSPGALSSPRTPSNHGSHGSYASGSSSWARQRLQCRGGFDSIPMLTPMSVDTEAPCSEDPGEVSIASTSTLRAPCWSPASAARVTVIDISTPLPVSRDSTPPDELETARPWMRIDEEAAGASITELDGIPSNPRAGPVVRLFSCPRDW